MRLRGPINAILLVAIAALAALAWFTGGGGERPPPLTATDPRTVESFTVHYPRAERAPVVLERRPGGWWLRRPIERAARDGRVVSALAILAARSTDCYPRDAHEPGDFGLARPRLRLEVGTTTVAFGDRAADGRRYVAAGERFCLLADRYYPLLRRGTDALAQLSLLAGQRPDRIATPAAEARRDGEGWRLVRGEGDAAGWAATWRAGRAERIALAPPGEDLGSVRVATAEGIHEWRIAAREPAPILVPRTADYGLVLAREAAPGLLAPPAAADR